MFCACAARLRRGVPWWRGASNTLNKSGRLRPSLFCCEAGLGHSVRPCGGALAEKYLDDFADFCSKGVRVVVFGEREGLPQKLVRKIEEMQLKTADLDAIA